MYRSVVKVLIGISACALALPALTAESTKPAVDIKDVFRAFLKQGKTSTGSSISILGPDILFVGDASGPIPYVDQIGTHGGVNVQTSLPITGTPERPQQDLSELLGKVREACGTAGGALVQRQMPDGMSASGTPQVARGFKAVTQEGLVGQFWCQTDHDEAVFMVEVRPAPSARVPLIPTGWDWNIGLRFATEAVLQKHQRQRAGYEKSVADLRSKLSVSNAVQVLATDLPAQVMQQWRLRPTDGPVEVCGLVTELKPPLAKVQLGAAEQWLEIAKLYPQVGVKKGPQELDSFSMHQLQSWCLR